MAQAAQESGQSESMEELLQSIKRAIEHEGDAETKTEAASAGDVLDLTQVVTDDGAVAPLAPALKPGAAPVKEATPPVQDIMQSIDTVLAAPAVTAPPVPAAPTPAPVSAPPIAKPSAPKPQIMEEGLVSDQAAQAAAAALKPIVEGTKKDYSVPHIPSAAMRGGNTVEDLLLEALRPMLKAWLDEHLPTIVQKIVEKEVKRIVTFHND